MTGLKHPFNIRRFWVASDGRKASEQATTDNTLGDDTVTGSRLRERTNNR
jgi:hypothetical protein